MTNKRSGNSNAAQQGRLLQYLKQYDSITTLKARDELSVMHPSGRIRELKQAGCSIITQTVIDVDAAGVKHRQALYVLCVGKKANAQQ